MTTLHDPSSPPRLPSCRCGPPPPPSPRPGALDVGGVPDAELRYAAKAFLCRVMVHRTAQEGLGLDVCSAGERELAVTTGFPPERIVPHGNAKSPRDLETAPRLGVGRIVIDSRSENARPAAAVGPDGQQKVMVRVVPGISAGDHEKIRTGTDDRSSGSPAYRPGEQALDLAVLARRVRTERSDSCAAAGLPVPRPVIEPGRAVVGPAGIAVYRVLAVKRTGAHTTFVAVDGGMSDNPRPALYGVRYAPRFVGRAGAARTVPVTVVGRHREAGDVLAADVELPCDLRPRRPATTSPWPPATTWSAAHRSPPSATATPGCWSAASPRRTGAAGTWGGRTVAPPALRGAGRPLRLMATCPTRP